MSAIEERQKKIVQDFLNLNSWEDRYKKIIALGKALPELPEADKVEKYIVKGCQSQVWLIANIKNGKMQLRGDSDAMIVKGLLAILLTVFADSTPQEVLAASVDFLKDMGFESNLSPSRSNGLYSMVKQIKLYAQAFAMMGTS